VDFDAALARAKRGEVLPVYVISGTERFLRDELVQTLRQAALAGGLAELNEDKFTAGEGSVDRVLSAARTVPMMAKRRFVLVRNADRWDNVEGDEAPLDQIAEYAKKPADTTCLVVVADKLDKRRRLSALARKEGFFIECEPLPARELPEFVVKQAQARGHTIDVDAASLLAELAGPELGPAVDAVERLSLYVGPNAAIDEDAVAECVARIRTADTWQLVDAVGRRDLGTSLRLLADVYDPRDRGLPVLGALAWSVRQLARVQAAMDAGASPDEAARKAGIMPFRIRETVARAKQLRSAETQRWLMILAETDVALKGSKRPSNAILEDMITRLCRR
jgi:DNA polymerase-3 subunit delta